MFTRIRLSAFHETSFTPWTCTVIYYVCTEAVWAKLLANFKSIIFRNLWAMYHFKIALELTTGKAKETLEVRSEALVYA